MSRRPRGRSVVSGSPGVAAGEVRCRVRRAAHSPGARAYLVTTDRGWMEGPILDDDGHGPGCHIARGHDRRRRTEPAPLLGLRFVRKALEGVVRDATHPATFPNAPQRAADPAEEMDAGRPGPECGRPRGAAGRTLRRLRNAGVVASHCWRLPQTASTSVPRNVHDWRGISRLPSAWTATFDCRTVALPRPLPLARRQQDGCWGLRGMQRGLFE